MRLIDADALIKRVREEGLLGDGYSCSEREEDLINMVDDLPTIDPALMDGGKKD